MRSSSDTGIQERQTDRGQTSQRQCDRGYSQKALYIVGIGPGSLEHLSQRAHDVLTSVDTVAGYSTYIELIRPLIRDKQVISTAMTKEVERVQAAIDAAFEGHSCALVSSGDPGIYAMAGLVLEMCKQRDIPITSPAGLDAAAPGSLLVEVVPGIPALCSGASLLGAPLTHDFAVISLSDLLTPWELIEKRLEAAAMADFVIVLFNPKSKRRSGLLKQAQQIVLRHRPENTPVGIVVSAMRPTQDVRIVPLKDLDKAYADMQTTVFIGSSASSTYMDFMITPRGYSQKYELAQ